MFRFKKINERFAGQISRSDSKIYKYIYKKEDKTYLLKFVPFYHDQELIITSKYYFCIVNGSFSKSKKPKTIKKMEDFVDLEIAENNTFKVLVLYPGSKAIIRYINECDAVKVRSSDDVFGLKVINYEDLDKL